MMATGGGAAAGRTGYEAAGRRHKDPRWEWLGMGASVGGAWCLSGRRARPAVVVGEDGKWWMDILVETPLVRWGVVVVVLEAILFGTHVSEDDDDDGPRSPCHYPHSSGVVLVASPLLSLW